MSILQSVTTGKVARPHLMLVYGPDGVGKSTFAAGAPEPLFLGAEEGTNHLDVARLAVPSLAAFREALTELGKGGHQYQTVVIDTLDWLETLVYAEVIATYEKKVTSIEDIPYGKGRVRALEVWRELLPSVAALRDRGLNVIAIAHSMIKRFDDPALPQGYDRHQLKLQSGAATDVSALWREFVDTVVFATYEVSVSPDDKRRGYGDGTRVLYTERRPGFDAKNRFGLPFELPMSWEAYAKAAAQDKPAGADDLSGLVAQITDAALRAKAEAAVKKATGNPAELAKVKARLLAVVSKGKE